jgi:hypothetical protein
LTETRDVNVEVTATDGYNATAANTGTATFIGIADANPNVSNFLI